MKMHSAVQEERRALRKTHGKNPDFRNTEPEEKGEMDNFQDLQLGSITPVVRVKDNSPCLSSHLFFAGHEPNFHTLKFNSTPFMRAP